MTAQWQRVWPTLRDFTIRTAFVRRDGRWLATHTHFSLAPVI